MFRRFRLEPPFFSALAKMGSKNGVRGDKKMKIPVVTKVAEEIRTITTSYYSRKMVRPTSRYVIFGARPSPGPTRQGAAGPGGGCGRGGGEKIAKN